MDQSITAAAGVASSRGGRSVAETTARSIADRSVGADESWFARAVKVLLPREKAGLAICIAAGIDYRRHLRSCERYAAGRVMPPATFLRALLRSEQGLTWLQAVMDESNAAWWVELKRAIRIAEALRHLD